MINHGISTGALFLLIGFMYDRRHTRELSAYGGQAKATPLMAALFLVVTFSSIGLPGTNGFVGEFLVLLGAFNAPVAAGRWWGILAASGVILGAVYMLNLYQKAFLGPMTNPEVKATPDLNGRELVTLMPLIIAIVVIGVFPQPLLDMIKKPVSAFVVRTGGPAARADAAPSVRKVPGQRKTLEDLKREGVRAFPTLPNGQPIFREPIPGGLPSAPGLPGGAGLPPVPGAPSLPPMPKAPVPAE